MCQLDSITICTVIGKLVFWFFCITSTDCRVFALWIFCIIYKDNWVLLLGPRTFCIFSTDSWVHEFVLKIVRIFTDYRVYEYLAFEYHVLFSKAIDCTCFFCLLNIYYFFHRHSSRYICHSNILYNSHRTLSTCIWPLNIIFCIISIGNRILVIHIPLLLVLVKRVCFFNLVQCSVFFTFYTILFEYNLFNRDLKFKHLKI